MSHLQTLLLDDQTTQRKVLPEYIYEIIWVQIGEGASTIDTVAMSKGKTCIRGHGFGRPGNCYLCDTWDRMLSGEYPGKTYPHGGPQDGSTGGFRGAGHVSNKGRRTGYM